MFHAGLGQCGPKVPLLKCFFHGNKCADESLLRRADCEAELQIIWREIGEDKSKKLQELRQMISDAVDEIYDLALEESLRRRAALQESVSKSENRLKELLGPDALQGLARTEFPLQSRLNLNMTRLHELDTARVGGYGWIGGLVVLVELRNRVAALRQMLDLPPCNSAANIDEVIANTTEALHNLYPGSIPEMPTFPVSNGEQKIIFQRLQRFYQTLCAMQNAWVESFAQKDQKMDFGCINESDFADRGTIKKGDFLCEGREDFRAIPVSPFGCAIKKKRLKFTNKCRRPRNGKQHYEDTATLEQLSYKILKKLDDLSRQAKITTPAPAPDATQSFPSPSLSVDSECSTSCSLDSECSSSPPTVTKSCNRVMAYSPLHSSSISLSSDESKGGETPTSVLPETHDRSAGPGYYINIGTASCIWHPVTLVSNEVVQTSGHRVLLDTSNAFPCVCKRNDQITSQMIKQEFIHSTVEATSSMEKFFPLQNQNAVEKFHLYSSCQSSNQNKQTSTAVRNSQAPSDLSASATKVVPPPPPPPPPQKSPRLLRPGKSTKLKRSTNMGKLYTSLKKKVEGAELAQSAASDVALSHRSSLGGGDAREGMAEALAEITRRSAYFRKIEDDVQQHASSILEIKSALESFETDDMERLLKFHKALEVKLEVLTDESQVLSRFEGFPYKKLEMVRMAASLYSRLRSTIEQIENWHVEPPASEQVTKITSFFDKVKVEVEAIERTKDEDAKHFTAQKIKFSFDIITRVKEAMVDLSSNLSALALKESKKMKPSTNCKDECISAVEINKFRASFQILWKTFQLSFRVYNFAGGQDEKAELLTSELAKEMETYPSAILVA